MPQFKTHVDDNGRECTLCGKYKTWDNYKDNPRHTLKKFPACILCQKEYEKIRGKQGQQSKFYKNNPESKKYFKEKMMKKYGNVIRNQKGKPI